MIDNEFWWHGPKWLKEELEKCPYKNMDEIDTIVEEERRHTAVIATGTGTDEFNSWYLSTCSNYTVLIRRTAIYLRLMKLLMVPSIDHI